MDSTAIDLEALLEKVLNTAQIYYNYMVQYSHTWDAENVTVSQQTLGSFILFANQIRELQNHTPESEEEKAILVDCLLHISGFCDYIHNSLIDFM